MALRIGAIIAAVVLAYAYLLAHFYDLQITRAGYFTARAESEYRAADLLDAPRGAIYFEDKSGGKFAVALEKDFPEVYAVPKVVADAAADAKELAPILDSSSSVIFGALRQSSSSYVSLAKKVPDEAAQAVADLNLKGIYVDSVPGRFYPHAALASQVLGFVGPSASGGESGRYGAEAYFDSELSGSGGSVAGGKVTQPVPGEDLTLTLDPNIQAEAEQVLDNLVSTYKAQGGSVIVEDPMTGKILAMGSRPTFDPNSYGSFPIASFMNPAVQQIYEPGSVVKLLTMAAGIDAGKITPQTTYVDKGEVLVSGHMIKNWDFDQHGGHGRITMTNVIEQSLNTGAVFAEQTMGREIFLSYLKKFGLDQKTGITLPGEVRGDLRRLTPKAPEIQFASASFGQGIAMTPLELLQAVGAIANGGTLLKPYIVEGAAPQPVRRVISEDTAKKVAQMMVSAVDVNKVAAVEGYAIAGKTGTAYVPDLVRGGYSADVENTYVGFGPAAAPRFIILIKLDKPYGAPLSGESVVPAFQSLAQYIVNYYNIPPDRISGGAAPAAAN